MVMRELKDKMQFAAMILFAVLFGLIFIWSVAAGTPADVVETVGPRDDPTEIVDTATATTQTVYVEQPQEETTDYGLMQINECNHEWLSDELGINDFLDGEQNITAGIYLLSDLYNKYEDMGLALMAYNCGEKGANNLWQQGIYSTEYSRTVLAAAESLEQR